MSRIKNISYRILDTVTLGRGVERTIDGWPIRFPARWSKYYDRIYDPETSRFLNRFLTERDTFLDIGGHIGLFAVVAARLVGSEGRVYSFEPTPLTRDVLQEVVDLNGCSQTVEVRGEAVSSRCGETMFFDTGDEISNANSLVKTDRSKNEIRVPMISVDEFASERKLKIDCIKIDVEGAELDVLKGAQKTFMTDRPAARLGLHPSFIVQNGQSLDEIWDLLTKYKLDVVFEDEPVTREWFCSRTELFDVNLIPS